MTNRIIRQSLFIVLLLAILSIFPDWSSAPLNVLSRFGNTGFIPLSILIGGLIGLANLKGLARGVEQLTGENRTGKRFLILSIFRLFILLAVIILLAATGRVNLLALMSGMAVVFIILIKEGLKTARES